MTTVEYIDFKVKVLKELGMKNTDKVKAYLTTEIKGISTEYSQQAKVDRLCHDMISNYFEGDKTFVRK